ncbi:unnamed protein product [Echinostoma caproni]|uniref:Ras-GEF domain-containing protein n=1 Tax=Echinostoma caproni TaxID=27848 RepID=A0A183B6J0_9TREM|nr:unnamed protein product [Echinostoma caproni]
MENREIGGRSRDNFSRIKGLIPHLTLVDTPVEPVYPTVNYLQCALTTNSETRAEKKRIKSVKSSVASDLLVDRYPTKPNSRSPHQRSILPYRRETNEKAVVYLTATSLFDRPKQEMDDLSTGQTAIRKITQASDYIPKPKQAQNRTGHIFREPLTLITFRPLLAPFVPELLRLLVNSVETYCYQHDWALLFEPLLDYYEVAKMALTRLVALWYDTHEMRQIIKTLSVPVKIVTVRLFLDELAVKPLLFKRKHVNELVKIPMFDFFLRPHPRVRAIVQRAIMASSAVHKPELRGCEYGEGKTIESALIEVVLEISDYHFWNHLTSLKIRAAFKNITEVEREQVAVEEKMKRESVRQFLPTTEEIGITETYSDRYSDPGYCAFEDISKLHAFCQRVSEDEEVSSCKSSSPVLSSDSQTRSKEASGTAEHE